MAEKETGNHTTQGAEQTHAGNHEEAGDNPTFMSHGKFISVAHGRDRGDAPPDGISGRGDNSFRGSFGEEDGHGGKYDDQEGDQKDRGDSSFSAIFEKAGDEISKRFGQEENTENPENPKKATPAQGLDFGDTRQQINPAPFHILQLRFGPLELKAEIEQKKHADTGIGPSDHELGFGGDVKDELRRERADRDDRKDQDDGLKRLDLGGRRRRHGGKWSQVTWRIVACDRAPLHRVVGGVSLSDCLGTHGRSRVYSVS